jgi:hypothetical protein
LGSQDRQQAFFDNDESGIMAHNEEGRIAKPVRNLSVALDAAPIDREILFVNTTMAAIAPSTCSRR